jgi:uncharacterized membrane protein YraQ (UPF0718 family)
MSRAFGKTNLKSVVIATGLGAASSSCSYAAAAAARSAIQQGAALIPALAFMFASTNLVIELGVVLWLLMGWRFVLAEFVGAFVLIGLVWSLMSWFLPKSVEEEMRRHASRKREDSGCCQGDHHHENKGGKWTAMGSAFAMDWMMIWKELLAGFLIAGFIATLVPHSWWQVFFLQTGPEPLRLIENAVVGPLVAIASFVCSVGNIPLAGHLWANGISFGGVISFIYADLLVVPLIIIYGKYYGVRPATWITGIFFVAMVTAGIVVDVLFNILGLIPTGPRGASAVQHARISWNYTSWLDLIALLVFAWFFYLHLRKGSGADHVAAHH